VLLPYASDTTKSHIITPFPSNSDPNMLEMFIFGRKRRITNTMQHGKPTASQDIA